jgi:hypothetical protein
MTWNELYMLHGRQIMEYFGVVDWRLWMNFHTYPIPYLNPPKPEVICQKNL